MGVLSDSVTFTINLTDIDEEEEPLSLADALRNDLPQSNRWHHQHQDGRIQRGYDI